MSDKLPRITAKELLMILYTFPHVVCIRQKWSHKRFVNEKNQALFTVPDHGNNYIHPKILKDIIAKLDISIEFFKKLL